MHFYCQQVSESFGKAPESVKSFERLLYNLFEV